MLSTLCSTTTVRLAGDIQTDSIIDGEGLRTVIWFQGCSHNCKGCHNPETHDFKSGKEVRVVDIFRQIDLLNIQDGITFSGGDPMYQIKPLAEIAKYVKEKKLNVWCYTGFVFEDLIKMVESEPLYLEALKNIDVLVDGKFILDEKSLNLKFKGSRNQRIIDVKKSLKNNEVVLIPKYRKEKVFLKRK